MTDPEELDPEEQARILFFLENPEVLKLYGYKIQPKGCMAVVLCDEFDLTFAEAEVVARRIEDAIFKAGYVYFHEQNVRIVSRKEFNGE